MQKHKFIDLRERFWAICLSCLAVIACTASTVSAQAPAPKPCFDFTGSGRTSFATYTSPLSNIAPITWHLMGNGDGIVETFAFGRSGIEFRDAVAPGYYDGDNRADAAVIRDSAFGGGTKTVFIRPSTSAGSNPNAYYGVQWGMFPDRTSGLQADYDGDGRDDLVVARIDTATGNMLWYILRSGSNTFNTFHFGLISDIPVTGADYNGDGRAEITVIRKSPILGLSDTYFAADSFTGELVLVQNWGGGRNGSGENRDIHVVGDYLGDSRADFAVMRLREAGVDTLNATWYILENGGSGQIVIRQFGYGGGAVDDDMAICGDYNGDGKQDIAVFRVADSTFYWLNSPGFDTFSAQQAGRPNQLNLPFAALHTQ